MESAHQSLWKVLDPKNPNTPTTISQNFDGRILLNDSWFPVNRKNQNPHLFKFCSELRNRKSDPVINIFHGGGQNREFCKTVSRKQNGGVFKCPFLDRGITSIVKEVDTQVGRHSDNTNFVRSPFINPEFLLYLFSRTCQCLYFVSRPVRVRVCVWACAGGAGHGHRFFNASVPLLPAGVPHGPATWWDPAVST